MYANSAKGFGLLEAMLSIAIMLVMLIVGLRFYEHMAFERDAAIIEASADYLTQGLNLYYYSHCASNPQVACTPTLADIENELATFQVQASQIQNPWAGTNAEPFTVSIGTGTVPSDSTYGIAPIYTVVTAAIDKPVSIAIARLVGASTFSDDTVTWQYIIQSQPVSMQNNFWPLDTALAMFKTQNESS